MENKMMVMRRALRDVSRVAEEMTRGTITGESVDRKTVDAWAMRLCEIVSRDLAIPLRQCDVGTAEEQMKRQYDTMCNTTNACPDSDWSCRKCFAHWAQTPYAAAEGGAK